MKNNRSNTTTICSLVITLLVGGICLPTIAVAERDGKTFPATQCQTMPDAEGNAVYGAVEGTLFNSHRTEWLRIHCPLVRDLMQGTLGPQVIMAQVKDAHPDFKVSCSITYSDVYYSTAASVPFYTYQQGYRLYDNYNGHSAISSNFTTYSVICSIPPRYDSSLNMSGVKSIDYTEVN